MADVRKDHSWLEKELAGQLRMVSAPDSLWRGIHEQRRPLRVLPRRSVIWTKWPVAAAVLVTVLAAMIWRSGLPRDSAPDLETLAGSELRDAANGSGKTDLRSTDPREIRAWVREKSGIDVRMPERMAPGNNPIRLLGVRMTRLMRHRVAVITYKVGDDLAAMLVSDTGYDGPAHPAPRIRSTKGMSLYSWSLGSNEYAIAFGGEQEAQRSCLLCHAVPPAVVVFR